MIQHQQTLHNTYKEIKQEYYLKKKRNEVGEKGTGIQQLRKKYSTYRMPGQ